MASSQVTARIEEFQREQNRRTAAHLHRNIKDFNRLAAGLNLEIRAEEERTRISDPTHVGYSMFAKAVRARRDNLLRSRDELSLHLQSVHAALNEVPEEQHAA
jgi:hypothetical protein